MRPSPRPIGSPLRARTGLLLVAPLTAGALIVLLVVLVISGHAPVLRSLVRFKADGLVALPPQQIARVEFWAGKESVALRRTAGGWTLAGTTRAAPAELARHVEAGLRFMHVSGPSRKLTAGELVPASFAAFGLEPPRSVLVLASTRGAIATVYFGALNPAGTSQYVRLAGAATVYLMPRHVGNEWQVAADMARRLRAQSGPAIASRGASLLLPVSLAQVWAVEIVFAGKLTRFERDAAGNWFRHVGQHSHAGGGPVHVADPAQARIIAAALEAFGATMVESRIAPGVDARGLARFGLDHPPVIVMLYARDNSTALARLEVGGAANSVDRYARLVPDGDVVTLADFEVRRLTGLLKSVGAGS